MLCVSLLKKTNHAISAAIAECAEGGAHMVEIRLDAMAEIPDHEVLFKNTRLPTIATCRRVADGGFFQGEENPRLGLLRSASEAGATYIDIELDAAKGFTSSGPAKRIISHHIFEETPHELSDWISQFAHAGGDIHKFVTCANSPADAFRMLQARPSTGIPFIGFCMGQLGQFSRVLCLRNGAPWTYVSINDSESAAAGQITLRDMKSWLQNRTLSATTKIFGVVGDPVSHSLSPLVHNAAFAACEIDAIYLPFSVPRDQLPPFLDACNENEVQGLSVTLPHKQEAHRLAYACDDASQHIGAANTLHRTRDGWAGHNTDAPAALDCIKAALASSDVYTLEHLNVLILGDGGVARAIGHALNLEKVRIFIASRNEDTGLNLARDLAAKWVPWEDRSSVDFALLVNGTPIGMHPDTLSSPFPIMKLPKSAVVFDSVYRPHPTALVQGAREIGLRAEGGLEHFIGQAALQYKIFTDLPAPVEVMRAAVESFFFQPDEV